MRKKYTLIVIKKSLKINRSRKFFYGVTAIYRKYGLISEDGSFEPAKATWYWSDDMLTVNIKS